MRHHIFHISNSKIIARLKRTLPAYNLRKTDLSFLWVGPVEEGIDQSNSVLLHLFILTIYENNRLKKSSQPQFIST